MCERGRDRETKKEHEKCGHIWIGFVCEWVSLDYVYVGICSCGCI